MSGTPGEVVADTLLKILPTEDADAVLARLPARARERLDAFRAGADAGPGDPAASLREFFDLLQIASRPAPAVAESAPAPDDPMSLLRAIPGERLVRVLDGEPPPAVALILSCLDDATSGDVLKRLPAPTRAAVSLRLAQLAGRNRAVLVELARAVVAKNEALGDTPPEPTPEERLKSLAQMLKTLPREDRVGVVKHFETTDPALAERIRSQLYSFEDVLRVPDRQISLILAELDTRSVALALVGADPDIAQKILSGLSSRAKANVQDETQMLGSPPPAQVKEARDKITAIIRREEEAGKIQL
jgi:flagellar motor switch protein FliG